MGRIQFTVHSVVQLSAKVSLFHGLTGTCTAKDIVLWGVICAQRSMCSGRGTSAGQRLTFILK